MKLTKLSAAWLPEWTCRLMPAPAGLDAGTASQLIPGVRQTTVVHPRGNGEAGQLKVTLSVAVGSETQRRTSGVTDRSTGATSCSVSGIGSCLAKGAAPNPRGRLGRRTGPPDGEAVPPSGEVLQVAAEALVSSAWRPFW